MNKETNRRKKRMTTTKTKIIRLWYVCPPKTVKWISHICALGLNFSFISYSPPRAHYFVFAWILTLRFFSPFPHSLCTVLLVFFLLSCYIVWKFSLKQSERFSFFLSNLCTGLNDMSPTELDKKRRFTKKASNRKQ